MNYPKHKGEIFFTEFFFFLQCDKKKNQPNKIVLKKVNIDPTNWLNQKRNLETQQNVMIFSYYVYF